MQTANSKRKGGSVYVLRFATSALLNVFEKIDLWFFFVCAYRHQQLDETHGHALMEIHGMGFRLQLDEFLLLHVQLNKLRYSLQEKVMEVGESLPAGLASASAQQLTIKEKSPVEAPPLKTKKQILLELELMAKAKGSLEKKLESKSEELLRLKKRLLSSNAALLQLKPTQPVEAGGDEPELAAGCAAWQLGLRPST
jgi:hypothetical protein